MRGGSFTLSNLFLLSSSTSGRSSDPHQLGRKILLLVVVVAVVPAQLPLGQRHRLVLPVPVDVGPSPVRVSVPVSAAAAAAVRVRRGLAAARGPLLGLLRDPGVDEDVLGGEALVGVLAEEAADEAAGAGGDGVGEAELAAPDLGEEALVLLPVEGVPERMKRVECESLIGKNRKKSPK